MGRIKKTTKYRLLIKEGNVIWEDSTWNTWTDARNYIYSYFETMELLHLERVFEIKVWRV